MAKKEIYKIRQEMKNSEKKNWKIFFSRKFKQIQLMWCACFSAQEVIFHTRNKNLQINIGLRIFKLWLIDLDAPFVCSHSFFFFALFFFFLRRLFLVWVEHNLIDLSLDSLTHCSLSLLFVHVVFLVCTKSLLIDGSRRENPLNFDI